MRRIDYIVVHCTDTIEGVDWKIDDVRSWHVNGNGWDDIGYHYLIYLDGTVVPGRAESVVGAHVKGYNEHSIGISYVGGKERGTMRSKDTRTDAQKQAMRRLLESLRLRYPNAKIVGHRDLAARNCPCFDAKKEYKDI
jgi:N-acetylmuramoyl-L-alanine amidase